LKRDVKHLTNYSPEYCPRIGNYRILFELEDEKIVIYRIKEIKKVNLHINYIEKNEKRSLLLFHMKSLLNFKNN